MTVETPTWWKTMGSDASGGWEKYYMVSEYIFVFEISL
jgi:hypothetical protein